MNPSGATHAMNVYTHGAVMDKSVDYYTGIQKWAGVTLCCSGALTDVYCSNFAEKYQILFSVGELFLISI